MWIARSRHLELVQRLLRVNPVVAILGARQVGKTSLAREVIRRRRGPTALFDLEDPREVARLEHPMLVLEPLRGLVVLDEIHRRPELFPVLRVLADRPRGARFLILGSASPDLLRQSSETLAGRIAFHQLGGLTLEEVGAGKADRLWLRGGFPRSYTARTDQLSADWRRQHVRTFVERDLGSLSVSVPAATMQRFWAMLAHCHGQTWNSSELARSFGVADTTVRRYLDLLVSTFMVRLLRPWHENLSKRQVKAPKLYLADSGILHSLLDIETMAQLERHPKLGASWEGFCLESVVSRLGVRPEQCFTWATHSGAELDLLVVAGGRRHGFEIKRTDAPTVTKSMLIARGNLRLDSLTIIHAGPHSFALGDGLRAVALSRLLEDVKPC
jgi:predicted AAA+ superfamily ATPase